MYILEYLKKRFKPEPAAKIVAFAGVESFAGKRIYYKDRCGCRPSGWCQCLAAAAATGTVAIAIAANLIHYFT